MRKIITLIGFILLMVWLWLYAICTAIPFYFSYSFSLILFIAGIALTIFGVITKPKKINKAFRSIVEKFDRADKFILFASIFLLFSALWLISYGIVNLIIYNFLPPVYSENITTDDLNETLMRWIDSSFIKCTNTYLVFSYLAIFTGMAYMYVGTTISQKKLSNLFYPALAFGIVVTIVLHICNILIINYSRCSSSCYITALPYSEFPYIFTIFIILFSLLSLVLVVLQKCREIVSKGL